MRAIRVSTLDGVDALTLEDIPSPIPRVDEVRLKEIENTDAEWFAFNELPELILDHGQMVKDSINELRNIAKDQPLGFELLPKLFTLPQLQTLYESIYNNKFDSRNFRKKILSLNVLEKTNLKDKSTSRKGAFLFGLKDVKLIVVLLQGLQK